MSDTTVQSIGHHLRRLRDAQDASQEFVSAQAGVSRANLSRIENGRFPELSIPTLERVCKALNHSLKEFFNSMPGD